MFLKFICKAFFAKNIVKSVRNGGINGRSSLPVLFPGQSTTFRQNKRPFSGKPGGPTGTNTAGKNDLLRGQNKVERNCRHAQGTQQIKSRSCRTVFLCGSFCFSVLICTPNTGCPVLGVHIETLSLFFLFTVLPESSKTHQTDKHLPDGGLYSGTPYNSDTGSRLHSAMHGPV